MIKQKEAVFLAICAVKGATSFSTVVALTKDERKKVTESLLADFKAGKIEYNGDVSDESKLNAYVSGLVSNWLRKDRRLNGNTKYEPTNPGTRVGDEQLKAMRQLLDITEDPEGKAEIQKAIDQRIAELKPKKPAIDVSALPEHLRHLVEQAQA